MSQELLDAMVIMRNESADLVVLKGDVCEDYKSNRTQGGMYNILDAHS